MLKVSQIKLPYHHTAQALHSAVAKKLKIADADLLSYTILKRSLDARKTKGTARGSEICYQYSVAAKVKKEAQVMKRQKGNDVSIYKPQVYTFPESFSEVPGKQPVIIGLGPAGLFCGLMLAQCGLKPILIERGSSVEERTKKVEHFWQTGELDTECNVQFGEGGAGTFSDGKLNTLVKDPVGHHKKVLEVLVEAGAPEEILYVQKPHIGTDLLKEVVVNIRNEIIRLGGTVRFNTKAEDFLLEGDQVKGIHLSDGSVIETDAVVLAIGHSARDTYQVLYDRKMAIEQKPFAIGVRVEHPQAMINEAQYGEAGKQLPAADYKLTAHTSNGRNVYTFCMCPGGHVVNAASEEGMLAVNGMSYRARNSQNANSAVIVNVVPEDFGSDHPLAGMVFQRKWERKAYEAGQGKVPVQLYEDFKNKQISTHFGAVEPVHKGAVTFANLWECLPDFVCESLSEGIGLFGKKIHGYDCPDAILSGVETRTSSPIKMVRDASYQSNLRGLFPCGEGAGYAGGITSAAMDGLRVAEAVAAFYRGL